MKKGLLIALVAVIADQLSKYIILFVLRLPNFFFDNMPVVTANSKTLVVTGFFNLVLVWNRGVSFGMFNHGEVAGYQSILLALVAVMIIAALIFWLKKSTNCWQVAAIGLIIGGAIGNVIDRAVYGAVVDFLDFHINAQHWPAFNIADSCICVGVFILMIESFFGLGIKKTDKEKIHEKN